MREKNMTKRRMALPLLLASAMAIAQAGCNEQSLGSAPGAKTEAPQAKVLVTKVWSGDFRRTVQVPATVEGYESAHLMSKIDGYVAEVHVNIGDEVKQGQPLARLDVPELNDEVERKDRLVAQAEADFNGRRADISLAEARLEEQEALLKLRNIELKRTSRLVTKGALRQQKLDEAEFAVQSTRAAMKSGKAAIEAAEAALASAAARRDVAGAELQKARSMAAYTVVTAPFDGVITRRLVDPGAFVRPASSSGATGLFDIASIDRVRLVVFLPMDQAGALDTGDEVTIDSIEGWPAVNIDSIDGVPITVSRNANSYDMASRMMRAEIDIDNRALGEMTGMRLKPGDYGKVTITLDVFDGIPTVPSTALSKNDDGSIVVVVDANDTCHETPVEVQIVEGDVVGLAGGVEIGSEIVAQDLDRVGNEMKLPSGAKQTVEDASSL